MDVDGSKNNKLDRFLVTDLFLVNWPSTSALGLLRFFSYHSPIVLDTASIDFGPSPFKIFNSWLNDPNLEKDPWTGSEWDLDFEPKKNKGGSVLL